MRHLKASILVAVCTTQAAAQQRFFYPEPPASSVRVTRDVRFATVDTIVLSMDVYRPANPTQNAPAVIFYSPFWVGEQRSRQSNDWVKNWARIAASNGIVTFVPDIRAEPGTGNAGAPARALGDDFDRFVAHAIENSSKYGFDPERVALFASSGASWPAIRAVQNPKQSTIKSAVIFYGASDVTTLRLDVPMLLVRAGLDSRNLNAEITRLVSLAMAQNAPLTLVNNHTGYHGFEGRNDDGVTPAVIEQAVDFIKRTTAPAYRASIRANYLRAMAAAQMAASNYRDAAATYAEMLNRRPDDPPTRFEYGQALLGDRQYGAACNELRRPPVSFGAIMPGTRACVLAGTIDTAIAFLRTVRKDWLPSLRGLRSDSVFAPLWGRAEFEALFRP